MKLLAFVGSPRKNGNSFQLAKTLCEGAKVAGHETELINITDLEIKGCNACRACKLREDVFCSIQDDMQAVYPKIIGADYIVFASPVYMSQITGQLKLFLDRWYPFMDAKQNTHYLPGKKYITVTVGGRSAETFLPIAEFYNDRLGKAFEMQLVENIIAGGLSHPKTVDSQPELVNKVRELGQSLR